MVYQPDKDELDTLVDERWITVRKHPETDLYIYNYTPKCMWKRNWTPATRACRGLILNNNYKVIQRPFEKFFHYGEIQGDEIPDEPFDAYEKVDGNLGILYWHADKPYIATRGSFTSEQAIRATNILRAKYSKALADMPLSDEICTYLFEITYPGNRIVVDYGDAERLTLLATINNSTGKEYIKPEYTSWYTSYNYPRAAKVYGAKLDDLVAEEQPNKEGYVVFYREANKRYKLKFQQYRRLHRLLTSMTAKTIWEFLKSGDEDLLLEGANNAPVDFQDWVKAQASSLNSAYTNIIDECVEDYEKYVPQSQDGTLLRTRWEIAKDFNKCSYPHVLFSMLTKKDVPETIWKLVKPEWATPWTIDLG